MTKSIKNKNGPRGRDTQKETPMGVLANDYLFSCASALDSQIRDKNNDGPCWGIFLAYLISKKALWIGEGRQGIQPAYNPSHVVDCLELGDGVNSMFSKAVSDLSLNADQNEVVRGYLLSMDILRDKTCSALDLFTQQKGITVDEITRCPLADRAEAVVHTLLAEGNAHRDLSCVAEVIRSYDRDCLLEQKGSWNKYANGLRSAFQWPLVAVGLAKRGLIRPDEMPFDWRRKLTVNRPTP